MCTTSASLARRITPAALKLSASARFLWFCYFCISPTAKISTGRQFISVPKEIKKAPVKGLGIAVTKVLIAACSASTLVQRPGCYFHLHLVYAIKLFTVLLCLLGILITAYLSRRLENITTSFLFIYNHIYLNVFLMLFGYLLKSLKHFYSPL